MFFSPPLSGLFLCLAGHVGIHFSNPLRADQNLDEWRDQDQDSDRMPLRQKDPHQVFVVIIICRLLQDGSSGTFLAVFAAPCCVTFSTTSFFNSFS